MYRFRPAMTMTLGVVMIFTGAAPEAQARIKYGLWAITIQTKMEAMPTEIPPETIKKCIRKDDLTPGTNKAREGCKPLQAKRKGNSVSWQVSCDKDNHSLKGSGKITYKGDSMTGTGKFQAGGKGLPNVKLQLLYTGKRLGECRN